MMGHLGERISALVDGQLEPAEEERAWEHVHACHQCRDLVEREGWVKTRLAGLGHGDPGTPMGLKGSLRDRCLPGGAVGAPGAAGDDVVNGSSGSTPHAWSSWTEPPGDVFLHQGFAPRPRRASGIAAIGGGAVGAAMVGVLALGAAPAAAPTLDGRVPATSISQPGQSLLPGMRHREERP